MFEVIKFPMSKISFIYLSTFLEAKLELSAGKKLSLYAARELLRTVERGIASGQLKDTYPDPERKGFKFSEGKYVQQNGKGTSRDFIIFDIPAFTVWFEENEPKFKIGVSRKTKSIEELSLMSKEDRAKQFQSELMKLKKKHKEMT